MQAGVGFGFVALVFWILFAVLLAKALGRGSGGIRVEGEITGSRDFLDRGRTMFVSEFRATTPDGKVVHGTGTMAKSWKPEVGKRIALLYRPNDNEQPLVEAGPIRFVASGVVGLLALVMTAVTAIVFVSVAADASRDDGTSMPGDGLRKHTRKKK